MSGFFSWTHDFAIILMTFQKHVWSLYLQGLDRISLLRGEDWSKLSVISGGRRASMNVRLVANDEVSASQHKVSYCDER